jgi:hypothetical protein
LLNQWGKENEIFNKNIKKVINMVISIIIGVIILAIVVFTLIKMVKNVIFGFILIGLTVLAAYLILGSIPILGFVPGIPTSFSKLIGMVRRFFYEIEVAVVSRDSQNNLLITIENTGRRQVSNITIHVNNETVDIINKPKDPLKPGDITTIQTNWYRNYTGIIVQSSEVNTTYSK